MIQELCKKLRKKQDDDPQAKEVDTSSPGEKNGGPRDASAQAAGANSTSNSFHNARSALKATVSRRRATPKDEESATSKSDSNGINGNVK